MVIVPFFAQVLTTNGQITPRVEMLLDFFAL